MKNLTFITGAARSGKSLLAEELAAKSGRMVYYLATMQILTEDAEQTRRLELHRKRRPAHWQTIEAPFFAHEIVDRLPDKQSFVIFDCLSLYVTNILVGSDIAGNEGKIPGSAGVIAGGVGAAGERPDKEEPEPYLKETEIMSAVSLLISAMSKKAEIEFVMVSNEVGWGIVPETKLGRVFRDFLGLANQQVAAEAASVYLSCSGLRLQLK